jgi:hypothetical protein
MLCEEPLFNVVSSFDFYPTAMAFLLLFSEVFSALQNWFLMKIFIGFAGALGYRNKGEENMFRGQDHYLNPEPFQPLSSTVFCSIFLE